MANGNRKFDINQIFNPANYERPTPLLPFQGVPYRNPMDDMDAEVDDQIKMTPSEMADAITLPNPPQPTLPARSKEIKEVLERYNTMPAGKAKAEPVLKAPDMKEELQKLEEAQQLQEEQKKEEKELEEEAKKPSKLDELRKERDQYSALLTMLGGLNEMAAAEATKAGAKGVKGKDFSKFAGHAEKKIVDYLNDIQAKRRAEADKMQKKLMEAKINAAELDYRNAEALSKPDTDESRFIQQTVMQLAPSMDTEVIGKTSGDALLKAIPGLQTAVNARMRKQALEAQRENKKIQLEREERRLSQRDKEEMRRQRTARLNAARGLLKDDPRYKKAVEQSMEFDSVELLLDQSEKGNPTALSQLGTKMARAMGEVGVLTDADVVRYVQGRPWKDKLMSWYEGGMRGKLPEEVSQGLQSSLDVMRDKLRGDIVNVHETASSRLRTAFPEMGEKEAAGLLGFDTVSYNKDRSKAKDDKEADKQIEEEGKHQMARMKAIQLLNSDDPADRLKGERLRDIMQQRGTW